MKNKLLESALEYLSKSLSIIPVNPTTKKPMLYSWKEFQNRLPTVIEIEKWWTKWPWANIGLVTGKLSGLCVVDIDPRNGGTNDGLTITISSRTGGGGRHYFYKYYPDLHCKNGLRAGVDFKTDGGYVVLPPSQHNSGNYYEWVIPPGKIEFNTLPPWIVEESSLYKSTTNRLESKINGVGEGQRNETATSVVGKLLVHMPKEDWESVCWPLTKAWNAQNTPPLSERELKTVFDSISSRELSRSENRSIYSNDRATEKVPLETISLGKLREIEFPPNKWIVDGLIPQNGITCISGKPKVGKSLFSLSLAGSIASGTLFLDKFEVETGGVLVISKEDPLRLIKERTSTSFFTDKPIYFCTTAQLLLDSDTYISEIIGIIREHDIKVIIIDSFRRIFRGEENSSQSISQVHNIFKMLLKENISIIFIHHHSKDGFFKKEDTDKLRGSSDILAMLDSLIILERKSEDKIKITQAALRSDKPLKPFLIRIPNFTEEDPSFKFVDFVEEDKEKKFIAKEDILNFLQGAEYNQTEIINNLIALNKYRQTTIKEALAELVEEQEISFRSSGNQKIYARFQQQINSQLSMEEL